MADRFFIGKYDQDSGLQTDYKPWAITDSAFSELTNAYVFRGRVRKRFGSKWLAATSLQSRLRVNIGTTDGAGNFAGFTPGAGVPQVVPEIGQLFSIGTEVFTVNLAGAPAPMLRSGTSTSATYNFANGAVTVTGAAALTTIYFYPALAVMGLRTFEAFSNNDQKIVAFDQVFAYEFSSLTGGWERISGETFAGAARWIGTNSEFFWTTTWQGVNANDRFLFTTNFDETDPNCMRFLFFTTNQWNNFRPPITATQFLNNARILIPFKNRLLALNTWEGPDLPPALTQVNFPNRVRYSAIGSAAFGNAWRQDIPGNGNALDAPTTEAIISAEFVKDRLIVFFTNSTWELVYTGNQSLPFAWQQINTELGAESTFSVVPFDKVALGIGNVGIHACNGANVERIDQKIPQYVFDIHYIDNGLARVYGIRDFYVEMVYWTFPNTESDETFPYPNTVLVYNYKTGTWAINEDSITCFGYFQQPTDVSWDSLLVTWDDPIKWNSGSVEAKFRQVIAGNQQGYTFLCVADLSTNASVLQITDMTVTNNEVTFTSIDHNLREDDYVFFEGVTSTGNLNLLNGKIFPVNELIGANTFNIDYVDDIGSQLFGTYKGAGLISRVSNISIKTKEYNFYADKGRNAYVSKVDFMVDSTPVGAMQVDYFASSSVTPLLPDAAGSGTLLGTGTLETFPYTTGTAGVPAPIQFEEDAVRLWHPVYLQAEGEVVQLQLTMNDTQMRDPEIRKCDFQLHAMIIHAQPTSSRLQ